MQEKKWIKWLLVAIMAMLITGCGGGGGEAGLSAQQKAINLIVAYAESNGTTEAPDADDYAAAGVANSDDINVTAVNNYIAHLAAEDKKPENQDDIREIAAHFGIELLDTLLLSRYTEMDGEEPWITNGTTAGTRQLANLNNAPNSSYPSGGMTIGGDIYFSTVVPNTSMTIWKTDGVTTTMLYEDTTSSQRPKLINFQNKLYVITRDKLLKINDDNDGLEPIKSIYAGFQIGDHVVVGDYLYFIVGYSNRTIWKTNGTEAGTIKVKSNYKGGNHLVLSGGKLYLTVNTTAEGTELWVLDPVIDDWHMISDHYVGDRGANPSYLTDVNGRLYFAATEETGGTEICRLNDTRDDIQCIDLRDGTWGSYPSDLTVFDGMLYFVADNGVDGKELWRVVDDSSEPSMTRSEHEYDVGNLKVVGDALYFSVGENALHLFDKESNTSSLIKDVGGPVKHIATRADGNFYFLVEVDGWVGDEYSLWYSDGTSAGTSIVKENGDDFWLSSWNASFLTMLNDRVYFPASDISHGTELWRSNGTEEGTSLFKDILTTNKGALENIRYRRNWYVKMGYTHYFIAKNTEYETELWRYDGIDTVCISRDKNLSVRGELTNYNGTLYFVANDHIHGEELWMSDGTPEGTVMVKDIKAQEERGGMIHKEHKYLKNTVRAPIDEGDSAFPLNLTVIDHLLYFSAKDETGRQLWKTNGTTTQKITSFTDDKVGRGYPGAGIVGTSDTIYFLSSHNHGDKTELWKKEGDEVTQLSHFTYGFSKIKHLMIMGDTAYFTVDDSGDGGEELWKTNTTGVERVTANAIEPYTLTQHKNKLYFSAYNGSDYVLWSYDGTTLEEEATNISIGAVKSIGDILYFTNRMRGHSGELWKLENSSIVTFTDLDDTGLSYYTRFKGEISDKLILEGRNSSEKTWKLWKTDGTDEGTVEVYPHDDF